MKTGILRHRGVFLVLPGSQAYFRPPTIGSAVGYVEPPGADERWLVLEADAGGIGFDNEITPEHAIAMAVSGKRAGESFLIAGDDVDGRKGTVTKVQTKYVFRLNRTLDEWQVRFPGIPGIEKFTVAPPEGDGIPDFMPIIRRNHERKRHVDRILDVYRGQPLPIHVAAHAIGVHELDLIRHLAYAESEFIRCNSPGQDDSDRARTALSAAKECILGLTAIGTLRLLDLQEQIASWPMRLVVSTRTMLEIESYCDQLLQERGDGRVVASERGLGIEFVEGDPRALQRERDGWKRMAEILRNHVEVRDSGRLSDLPPAQRANLIAAAGLDGAESLVLAMGPERVLWTDDLVLEFFGGHGAQLRRGGWATRSFSTHLRG